ncbi:hypothetical protein CUC08_Gglean001547 [Alternaria sp. MG1]|jgi:hypothetical protein|nr:hypothetical protein CUC08_Gglean001547 [Alternaria sp. MG1]
METSKHRLRRAARLSGPPLGLRRSKTDCTNDQAQPRPDYQAEGGAAPGLPHLQPTTPAPVWSSGETPHRSLSPNSANNPNEWVEFSEEFRDGLDIKSRGRTDKHHRDRTRVFYEPEQRETLLPRSLRDTHHILEFLRS